MKLINLDTSIEHKAKSSIQFISFDDNDVGESLHSKPQIGYACIVDHDESFGFGYYTWLTSPIVEVISDTEFKTLNTHYKIELT